MSESEERCNGSGILGRMVFPRGKQRIDRAGRICGGEGSRGKLGVGTEEPLQMGSPWLGNLEVGSRLFICIADGGSRASVDV